MENNKPKSELVDSGERKSFDTGAVREIIPGKGRFDLIPFDAMTNIIDDPIYKYIGIYMETHNVEYLEKAVHDALRIEFHKKNRSVENEYDFLMKLAHHFEQGALKYDDDNWKKGLPIKSFIDSGCRHYCKYKLGHTDEPHFIAFTWNLICAIWTTKNIT